MEERIISSEQIVSEIIAWLNQASPNNLAASHVMCLFWLTGQASGQEN